MSNLLSSLWQLANRWRQPTPQQLQENLFLMLQSSKIEPTPELWFAMDKLLTDYFKVEVELKPLDMGKVFSWFNETIYPKVIANGGSFRFSDSSYQSCSISDLTKILHSDFTNYKGYRAEWFDCDNFAELLRNHLADTYNINSCAEVWISSAGGSHAWNIFIDLDCVPWGIEPQTDDIWPLNQLREGVYDLEQVNLFLM